MDSKFPFIFLVIMVLFLSVMIYTITNDNKRIETNRKNCGSLYNHYSSVCLTPREKCTELATDLFKDIHQKKTNTANTDQYTYQVNQYVESCIFEYKQS